MRVAAALLAGYLLMLLPDLVFPGQPAAVNITCTDAWCSGNFKATARRWRATCFGVSPLIAAGAIVLSGLVPGTARNSAAWRRIGQDLVLFLGCVDPLFFRPADFL